MKLLRTISGLPLILLLGTTALLCCHDAGSAKSPRAQSEASAKSAVPPQQLSSDGQASLRAIIEAGNLPELRWPDFSDYKVHVQKFYNSYGEALPWVRGMQPTAQAQQVIAILLDADKKGLSADDYDGPRWSDRLAEIKADAPNSSEADGVGFA